MVRQILEAITRRGLASAVSLGASSYLAHQFGSEGFGAYAGMLAAGQVVLLFCAFGLEVSPIYMMRTYPDHQRRIWTASLHLSALLAAVCLLLGLALLASPWQPQYLTRLREWGWPPFLYAAGMMLLLPQYACLQGLLQLRAFNSLQVAYPSIVLITILFVGVGLGRLQPSIAVVAWGCSGLVLAALAAVVAARAVPVNPTSAASTDPLPWARFFTLSVQSYIGNCIATLNSRGPTMLVALTLPAAASGYFAAAFFLGELFAYFSLAIATVTLPRLAGITHKEHRQRELERACRVNTTLTMIAVAVFLLLFNPLSRLLLGSTFSTPSFALMAAVFLGCAIPHSTARLLCTDLTAQGKPLWNALPNIPAVVVFVVAHWTLHERWHVWGAVAAYCASSLVFSTLAFVLYRRHSPIRLTALGLVTRSEAVAAFELVRQRATGTRR